MFTTYSAFAPSVEPTAANPAANPAEARARVAQMLDKMSAVATAASPGNATSDDDESGLVDFRAPAFPVPPPVPPPPPPLPPAAPRASGAAPAGAPPSGAAPVFSNYARSYGAPTHSSAHPHPQWLEDKIAYLIHLAEEQHSAQTKYIAEEFVLYLLLGVFVIFVVDGFARSGTYRR
jgi:hypothetical protein